MITDCVRELVKDDDCTGCAGCSNACQRHALETVLSAEGFYRPVFSAELCCECGACVKKCPVLAMRAHSAPPPHTTRTDCYAAWSNDRETHALSSSGGVFSELSKLVLEDGGTVFGCGWNDNLEPEHMAVTSVAELARLRGSKYVPSSIGLSLARAAALARGGARVLFSGTPCQVAALDRLLDAQARDQVTLIDMICHGVPSLALFSAYKGWLFRGETVSDFTFRDKSLCLQTIVARSPSGATYRRRASDDPFFRLGYGNHLSLMKSCFACRFAAAPRVADITLGDYWGVPKESEHPSGVSAVLVNTPAGGELIGKLIASDAITLMPADLADISRMNPRTTGGEWSLPSRRNEFLRDVARGHSFRWFYWRWYAPLRAKERVRDALLGSAVFWVRALKVKKVFCFFRVLRHAGNAH
ncbi:MAG: Coenzyme F420 hydrogenase/dehydrogenase, beta subunit C-terminal domain [Desulfuromonadales bacterium]|nr:Coenzyme F420 hydrogenase/dehydrogenase, beta subunit C-terminal domain [Desulfuromonadales bacterium]